ncbi:hypothetical protein [Streptomyces luteireticuli]|uniref:hypothetical protein n=1 Tax=Streptomyces luteireticuli TaxID=173858 RepID=UPI003555F71D
MSTQRRRNTPLVEWMGKQGLSAPDLARALNSEIGAITGREGRLTEGTVRKWRSGETQWPRALQRRALAQVSGLTAADLGFIHPSARPEEGPVHRRTFITGAGAVSATLAITPAAGRGRWRTGTSDVEDLREQLDRLTRTDQTQGGQALEQAAEAICHTATAAVNAGGCSDRIERMLYAVAADAVAASAWYALDGHRTATAAQHIDAATRLAALSRDPYALLHAWNSQVHYALTTGRRADAKAAAEKLSTLRAARQDPLCRSLAQARLGTAAALLADRRRAEAAFDRAHDTLTHSQPVPRPRWLGFYGTADLHSLHGKSLRILGRPQHAETHARTALATVHAGYLRDRALYRVHLAEAQLAQGERDAAADTIDRAARLAAGLPGSARVHTAIHRLTTTLEAAR